MIIEHIVSREPIRKGWSGDQKYRSLTDDGSVCLLRISPADRHDQKLSQYRHMEECTKLGIPMCQPLEFGLCADGVYAIHSWVNGPDAADVIPTLPDQQQYAYGLDAGRILRKIHTLPAPADAQPWSVRFNAKIDRKISMYEACPLKYEGGEAFLRHIAQNRRLLDDRPQTWQHGDYHIGNMMLDENGKLIIIDFDRDDFGDPWEEFNRIVWCAQDTPHFAAGMVDGYFGGPVPIEFWQLLALYICSNTLSSLPWAVPYGDEQVDIMRRQAADVLGWYDNMTTAVPSWYAAGKDFSHETHPSHD